MLYVPCVGQKIERPPERVKGSLGGPVGSVSGSPCASWLQKVRRALFGASLYNMGVIYYSKEWVSTDNPGFLSIAGSFVGWVF